MSYNQLYHKQAQDPGLLLNSTTNLARVLETLNGAATNEMMEPQDVPAMGENSAGVSPMEISRNQDKAKLNKHLSALGRTQAQANLEADTRIGAPKPGLMDDLGSYASDVINRPGEHPYGLYGAGGIAGGLAGAGIGGIVQYLRDEDVGPGMLTGGLLGAGAGLAGAGIYGHSKGSSAGMEDAGGTYLGSHPELMGGAGGALGGAGIGALIQYLRDKDILPGLLAGGAIGGGLGAGAGMLDRADHTEDVQAGMGASVGPENIDRAATSAPIEAPADGMSAMRQSGMSRPGLAAQAR